MRLYFDTKISCDEVRPFCQKCTVNGVSCNNSDGTINPGATGDDAGTADDFLQISPNANTGDGRQITFMSKPASSAPEISTPDSPSHESGLLNAGGEDVIELMLGRELELFAIDRKYALTREGLGVLRRFQMRTVYTSGTTRSVRVYRREIVRMACSLCHCLSLPLPVSLPEHDTDEVSFTRSSRHTSPI